VGWKRLQRCCAFGTSSGAGTPTRPAIKNGFSSIVPSPLEAVSLASSPVSASPLREPD